MADRFEQMVEDAIPTFEPLFQAFVAAGGVDPGLPALAEDWERQYRDPLRWQHKPTRCPHGKTLLTCAECCFRPDEGGYNRW